MRSLSASLLAAQTAPSRIPYFDLKFYRGESLIADYSCSGSPTDNTARLRYLKLHEFAYGSGIDEGNTSDVTTIILNDYDRSVPDLRGCSVDIEIGDVTDEGNESSEYPRMWVYRQYEISAPSTTLVQLTLIGWADMLSIEHARADDTITNPSLTYLWNKTHTPYQIMSAILHADVSYIPFTLDALTVDDGIIDTFLPYFILNPERGKYEKKLPVLARLSYMTMCYMKPLADNHIKIVYPQEGDAADLTIYSDVAPWFYEFTEIKNETIPNSIWVFCDNTNMDTTNYSWPSMKIGIAYDADSYSRLGDYIRAHYQAPTITDQTDADNRAAAILARIKSERLSQALVIPHHCGIELYDHLLVKDKRGRSAYSDHKVRVTGLTHLYSRDKGIFRLSIYGSGLANFPMYSEEEAITIAEPEITPPEILGDPSIPQYEPPDYTQPSETPIETDPKPTYPNPMIHP